MGYSTDSNSSRSFCCRKYANYAVLHPHRPVLDISRLAFSRILGRVRTYSGHQTPHSEVCFMHISSLIIHEFWCKWLSDRLALLLYQVLVVILHRRPLILLKLASQASPAASWVPLLQQHYLHQIQLSETQQVRLVQVVLLLLREQCNQKLLASCKYQLELIHCVEMT